MGMPRIGVWGQNRGKMGIDVSEFIKSTQRLPRRVERAIEHKNPFSRFGCSRAQRVKKATITENYGGTN